MGNLRFLFRMLQNRTNSVMFDRTVSFGAAGTDISVLKETIRGQRDHLQKLQQELDAERESSATAASEALSMILRLQGEKAALAMEASQYKRMAEERMCHVETSLGLYEDILSQKELEIASLEFQVQAYRCKLLSCGYHDLSFMDEINNKALYGTSKGIGRFQSLPLIPTIASEEREINSSVGSGRFPAESLVADVVSVSMDKEVIEQSLDSRKSVVSPPSPPGDSVSYQEEIKTVSEPEQGTSEQKKLERIRIPGEDSVGSSSVHDIFEVPQKKESRTSSAAAKESIKSRFNDESLESPESVSSKTAPGRRLSRTARNEILKKDCGCAALCSSDCSAKLKQLRERIARLECKGGKPKCEIDGGGRAAEVSLLREIKEQLNSLQAELRSQKRGKKKRSVPPLPRPSPPPDGRLLLSLKEALLPFWM